MSNVVPSEEFFVVEKILNHRKTRKGKHEFLIKWADYDESHNSWEPKSNIADPLLVPAYFEKRKQEEQEKKRSKAISKKAPPPPPSRRPPAKAKTAPIRQRLAGGEIRPDSDSEEEQEASSSAAAAKKASEEEDFDSDDDEGPVPKKKKKTVVEDDEEEEEEDEQEAEAVPEEPVAPVNAPEDNEVDGQVVDLGPEDGGDDRPALRAVTHDHPPAPEPRPVVTDRPAEQAAAGPAPAQGNEPEIIELDDEEDDADDEDEVFIIEQPDRAEAQQDPVDPRTVHFPYDRLGRPIPNSSVAITESFIWPPPKLFPDVEQQQKPPQVVEDIIEDDSDFGDDLQLPELPIFSDNDS